MNYNLLSAILNWNIIYEQNSAETFAMAPRRSIAEGWKYVDKIGGSVGRHLKCKLCNAEFVGSLTRVMDHLLSISAGRGGGVEGCTGVSTELKATLQKDYDIIKKIKQTNESKRRRIQAELGMNYSPLSPFSSSTVGVGSSSQVLPTRETRTLNSLWNPVQKQEVDDALADLFYESATPFNVARSPYFINACAKIADFGKVYVPPSSEAIRTTLLKRSKERVTNRLLKIKES